MTTRQHTVIAAILLITGAYLIRMSAVEIQPSPEGFIAQAGAAVHEHGLMVDLAPVSSGGLTTGLIPPVVPTMIAAAMRVSGPSQGAVRWYSVVCMALSMWLTYVLGSRILSHKGALQAMTVMGVSMPLVLYGRQASIEVSALPFVLCGLLMLLKVHESTQRLRTFLYVACYVLSCVALGLTSVWASATLFLVALGYALITKRQVVAVAACIGLLASIPWLAVMFSTYGDQVLLASSIDVPVSELAFRTSGPLDAILLLIGSSPVFVLALCLCVGIVVRRSEVLGEHETIVRLLALWFVASMIVIALQADRLFHSYILLMPAAALLSVNALERFQRRNSPTWLFVGLIVMFLCTLCVLGVYAWRYGGAVKLILIMWMIALGIIVLVQGLRYRAFTSPLKMVASMYKPVYYGAIGAGATVAFVTVLLGSPYLIQGARSVAYELNDHVAIDGTFTYVYHKHHSTDGMNAQLDWYTQGWMTGQRIGYTHQSVEFPSTTIDATALGAVMGSDKIVYYHPGADRVNLDQMRAQLEAMYIESVSTKDYTLFSIR